MNVTPGWYPDPEDPANLRWWDGSVWTEHRQPQAAAPADDVPDSGDANDADEMTGTGQAAPEADPAAATPMADDGMDAPTVANTDLAGLPVADPADVDASDEPADPESASPWSSVDEDTEVDADGGDVDSQVDSQVDSTVEGIDPEATSVTVGAPPDPAAPEGGSPTDPTEVEEAVEGALTESGEATMIGVSAPPWAASDPTGAAATPFGQAPPPPVAPGFGGDVPPGPPTAPGAPPAGPTPPGGSPSTKKSRKKPILIGLGVIVVLALVAGAAFVILSGDDGADYTWDGNTIANPQRTLDEADEVFLDGADERNGSVSRDSRCYFVLPADEDAENPTDVADYLRCGPVLFVDDDPDDGVWLTYALDDTQDDRDDTVLTAAEQPQSGQPSELEDAESLSRPDDEVAPDGDGGLDAPRPPRAEPGILLVDDPAIEDVDLESTFVSAAGQTKSVSLLGFAELDRYGRDEDARRPADGEKFLAFEISPSEGDALLGSADQVHEAYVNSTAVISLDIDGEITELIGADEDPFIFSSRFLVSVPESIETADVVLEDSGLTQRISLLTQEPAADNVQVLTRFTRDQDLNATQTIPVTIAGGAVANANFTVTIRRVQLLYFISELPDKIPSGPDKAFLYVDHMFTSPEADITEEDNIGLEPGHLHLRIGDEIIEAQNLADGDSLFIVFEVPANFETGTLEVRGAAASGDVTVDLGDPAFHVPIDIDNF